MDTVNPMEVLEEINNRFPKELEICTQAVLIKNLQAQIPQEEEE